MQFFQQPNYTSVCQTYLDTFNRYKESLELDLPTIYGDIYNDVDETYTYCIEALNWSISGDDNNPSYSFLKEIGDLLPRLLATRHVYSYVSLIHPILFRESWNPKEITNADYAGTNPSIDEIYWGLTHINLFASKVVFDKMSGNELVRKALKDALDDKKNGLSTFRRCVEKLSENDIFLLDNIGNFRRYLIIRDCGALQQTKEQVQRFISNEVVSIEDIANRIRALVYDLLAELSDAIKNVDWQHYFQFEQKYVTDILEEPEYQSLITEVKEKKYMQWYIVLKKMIKVVNF